MCDLSSDIKLHLKQMPKELKPRSEVDVDSTI